MHSMFSQSLIGALLLLQLAAATVVSDQEPSHSVVPGVFSRSPAPDPQQTGAVTAQTRIIPPAPDLQQRHALAVFRLKDRHPCVCINGGRCQRRVRRCECPLGYDGPHCEIVDHELFALVEADEAAKKAAAQLLQQQEEERQRVRFTPYDWLLYVALVAVAALLLAMVCVFADLATAYCPCGSDEKRLIKKLSSPSATCDNGLKGCSIYTLPLPPPYSETALPAFAHSTPCCKLQPVQQLQPDFVAVDL